MRPQGSPAELERRRLRAIELLQRDVPVHVVAERLGVDRRSVRRWKRAHRRQGRAGLRARLASGSTAEAQCGSSAVDWRGWSSRGRKRPAIAQVCGPVDESWT